MASNKFVKRQLETLLQSPEKATEEQERIIKKYTKKFSRNYTNQIDYADESVKKKYENKYKEELEKLQQIKKQ